VEESLAIGGCLVILRTTSFMFLVCSMFELEIEE